jgi:hypothetical protein
MLELLFKNGKPVAPRAFWQPIEQARGNRAAYRAYLFTLSRDEMIATYKVYKELETELFSDEHIELLGDSEGLIKDAASWVVTQGEAYYYEVYDNPEKTPTDDSISSSFGEEIVGVFAERFNEWIPR